MHNVHTLYHIKRQYANTRPHGRDEKQQKIRFYLSLPLILGYFFDFSSTNTQAGAQQTRKKGNIFTVLCAHKNTAIKN